MHNDPRRNQDTMANNDINHEEVEDACCGNCQDDNEQEEDTEGDLEPDQKESTNDNTQALDACQKEADAWKDKYLRVNADIENLKRRMYKEQEQAIWRARLDIFTPLLGVMDNFDRAQADISKQGSSNESQVAVAHGITLIRKELVSLFERCGIQEMTATKQFDPSLHEALVSVDSADHMSGDIVQVLQKGYLCNGQVLRPAKVSVAR